MVAAERTFGTNGDATAWLAKVQTDQSRGSFVDPRAGRITLTVFAEQFLEDRVLAERTLEGSRGLLDSHILPTLAEVSRSASSRRAPCGPGTPGSRAVTPLPLPKHTGS